jgi:hypothetical protein
MLTAAPHFGQSPWLGPGQSVFFRWIYIEDGSSSIIRIETSSWNNLRQTLDPAGIIARIGPLQQFKQSQAVYLGFCPRLFEMNRPVGLSKELQSINRSGNGIRVLIYHDPNDVAALVHDGFLRQV